MKIKAFGGIGEIGGNKILLEDLGVNIFLDFGISYGRNAQFLSEFVKPRDGAGLRDYFALGLLPALKGIYNRQIVEKTEGFEDVDACGIDGVLISHAHGDHIGYINKLRTEIPIYCTKETHKFIEYLEEFSFQSPEYKEVAPKFQFYSNKKGTMSRVKGAEDNRMLRNIVQIEYGVVFHIKHLNITPFETDHSLRGSTGFLIETSKGFVVYTGDIRFHGWRKDKSNYFVEKCAEKEIKLLITEGTRGESELKFSEAQLVQEIFNVGKEVKQLIMINFPARDMDRLITVYKQFQLHCSGHAPFCEIKSMIRKINPKFIMPVHSNDPEKFHQLDKEYVIVNKDNFEL